MLASIEPHAPGVDLRTFECDTCDHVETVLVTFGEATLAGTLGSSRVCKPRLCGRS